MKRVVDALKREKLFIFLLLLSVVIFMWDILFLNKIFLYGDYKLQHFPWAKAYSEAIKSFRLPLWNQYMGCGFPLFAEGQVGALYPLNLVMFFLLPFMAAYTYSVVLHFMLGGIFMYIFMRKLGLNGLPAILPAILFMFSSPYAGCFSNTASLKVLCWFPLVLYFIVASMQDKKPLLLLLLGVVMGFQLLAGAVQMAVYSIVVSTAYFLFLLVCTSKEKRNDFIKYSVFYCLAIVIAFLIWMPQFIPTYELVSFSGRGRGGSAFAGLKSFNPFGITTLVFPNFATPAGGNMLYVGILPLVFSIISLYKKKNKQVLFFVILFFVSLLWTIGPLNPLLKIPGFDYFRTPSKALFFSAFSLIVLSGIGFKHLLEELDEKKFKKIVKALIAAFVIIVLLLLAANVIARVFEKQILGWGNSYVEKNILGKDFHIEPAKFYFDKVVHVYSKSVRAISFGNPDIYVQIGIILLSILIFIYRNNLIVKDLFKTFIIIIIFCDLLFFSRIGAGFRGNFSKVSDINKRGDLIDFIKKDKSIFRIYMYWQTGAKDIIYGEEDFQDKIGLKANLNMLFGIDNLGIYTPLAPKRYQALLSELGCVDDSLGGVEPTQEALIDNLKILGMLNVKYVISQKEIDYKDLELLTTSGDAKIYLNKKVLPRAYLAGSVKVLKTEKGLLSYLKSKEFDPEKEAVLEEDLPVALIEPEAGKKVSLVYVKKYTESKITVETNSDIDNMLVLSDYYYPGWEAYVDGKKAKLYRANFIARAVYLPKGKHEVEFRGR